MSQMLEFADRFFAAVEQCDMATVAALYHEDVQIWHNYEEHVQTKAENLATLGSIPQRYDSFGYLDARRVEVEGGFLRQHTIKAGRGGKTALVPAILRVYVQDGLVCRIEEYFDRGQLAAGLS
jgi:ketosteroid isomerase-like protein